MPKITTLIVDDERLARLELSTLLAAFPQIEIIGEAADVNQASVLIHQYQPELLFLDINMPEKSGFDLLEEIDFSPKVIFTTAYDQYAVKAFENNALDYLLKPIREERLARAIAKISTPSAHQTHKPLLEHIFVRDGERCHFIKIRDIEYISSLGNYVQIHSAQSKAILKKSLNQIELKLEELGFFRANRSIIINLQSIKNIEVLDKAKLQVELNSGYRVDLSERKSSLFKSRLAL